MTTDAMSRKAIIFDFDGTIADSFNEFLAVMDLIVKRREPLSAAQIDELRKLPAGRVMGQLGIHWWQVPGLLTRGRREMRSRIDNVKVFAGVPEVLAELSQTYRIYILSTNSAENIQRFLDQHALAGAIEHVYGGSGLSSKAKHIRQLLRTEGLPAGDCVYIGDEVRDIIGAHRAGLRCIAVGWGYNHAQILQDHVPEALVASPRDIPDAITDLFAQAR
jgi:phosphoglycolate phosphatase-like HAD superfamily hydrolase